MKKYLSLLLVASLCCCMVFSSSALAAEKAPKISAKAMSDTCIRLVWTHKSGVSLYSVLRAAKIDGEYVEIGTASINQYFDDTLEPQATCYYKVKSKVEGIEYEIAAVKATSLKAIKRDAPLCFDDFNYVAGFKPNVKKRSLPTTAQLISAFGKPEYESGPKVEGDTRETSWFLSRFTLIRLIEEEIYSKKPLKTVTIDFLQRYYPGPRGILRGDRVSKLLDTFGGDTANWEKVYKKDGYVDLYFKRGPNNYMEIAYIAKGMIGPTFVYKTGYDYENESYNYICIFETTGEIISDIRSEIGNTRIIFE